MSSTDVIAALAVIISCFGIMSWAAYTLAPLIGYHKYGGREPALLLIRFATWAALYLGCFGIFIAALATATQDLFLAGKLAGLAGIFFGFAIHGPLAKS